MTLSTVILVNAVLGSIVVFGLLSLLVGGINADRRLPILEQRVGTFRDSKRLAA